MGGLVRREGRYLCGCEKESKVGELVAQLHPLDRDSGMAGVCVIIVTGGKKNIVRV